MNGLSRIVPGAVLLLATSACAGRRGADDPLTEVARTAAERAPAVDSVWPGYRPFERGFIVFRAGGPALLVASDAPPARWVALAVDDAALRDRLYRRDSPLPGLTGGIDPEYAVGARHYTAVELGATTRETLVTLYHEAFHSWQREAFSSILHEVVPADALEPEQVAGGDLERRILAAAVRARGSAADSLVAAFLAARARRYASLSDSARAIERSLERKEGTAQLVGYQAAGAALDLDGTEIVDAIARSLEVDLSTVGGNALTQYRWRAYGTGSAMGLLLDRLGAEWREPVAAGAALDSMLAAHARLQPDDAALARARTRFRYADLLAEAEREHTPAPADPIAAFLATGAYRLILEMEAPPGFDLGMSFDPGVAGFSNPDEKVTLLHGPPRVSLASDAIELAALDRPIMLDIRTDGLMRLVVLLPAPVRIDGIAPVDRTGPIDGNLSVRGSGTEVVVRGDRLVSITALDDAVTIRVRED